VVKGKKDEAGNAKNRDYLKNRQDLCDGTVIGKVPSFRGTAVLPIKGTLYYRGIDKVTSLGYSKDD